MDYCPISHLFLSRIPAHSLRLFACHAIPRADKRGVREREKDLSGMKEMVGTFFLPIPSLHLLHSSPCEFHVIPGGGII